MGSKQPVAIGVGATGLVGIISQIIVFYDYMTVEEVGLWAALVIGLVAFGSTMWARSKVVSEHTVKQTGQTLESMTAVADNPDLMLKVTGTGTGDGGLPSSKTF